MGSASSSRGGGDWRRLRTDECRERSPVLLLLLRLPPQPLVPVPELRRRAADGVTRGRTCHELGELGEWPLPDGDTTSPPSVESTGSIAVAVSLGGDAEGGEDVGSGRSMA